MPRYAVLLYYYCTTTTTRGVVEGLYWSQRQQQFAGFGTFAPILRKCWNARRYFPCWYLGFNARSRAKSVWFCAPSGSWEALGLLCCFKCDVTSKLMTKSQLCVGWYTLSQGPARPPDVKQTRRGPSNLWLCGSHLDVKRLWRPQPHLPTYTAASLNDVILTLLCPRQTPGSTWQTVNPTKSSSEGTTTRSSCGWTVDPSTTVFYQVRDTHHVTHNRAL